MGRIYLAIVLIGYLILSFSYALGPLFEPPDEALHYEYIRELADTREFPDPYSRQWTQFLQPPAYYLMLSPVLMVLPDDQFASKYGEDLLSPIRNKTASTDDDVPGPWENPYFGLDSSYSRQNKNLLLHERSETFPFDGNRTALAVFILRMISILLGSITLYFAYRAARLMWPNHFYRHVLTVSIVAFWPLFQRMEGAVNNDNLVFMLATIALYLILRQQNAGMTRRDAVLLGIVFGVSLLTKWHMSVLAIPMGVAVVTDRRTWRFVPLILVLTAIISGWWYLRNYILYGSFTILEHPQVSAFSVTGDNRFDLDHAIETFPRIFNNFWARFNIIAVSDELNLLFQLSMLLAGVGLFVRVVSFVRKIQGQKLTHDQWLVVKQGLTLFAFVSVWFIFIFYVSGVLVYGYQGRYTLGSLAGLAVLITLGWTALIPSHLEKRVTLTISASLFLIAVIIFAAYFRAAFRPMPVGADREHVINYDYEDLATLIGTERVTVAGQPGDTVEVALNWEAMSPAESRHVVVYVGAEGADGISQHSYPAGGNLLATDWEEGLSWREHHYLEIPSDTEAQRVYPLVAGLYEVPSDYTFTAYNSEGNPVHPVIGELIVHGETVDNAAYSYQFGDSIGSQEPTITQEGDQTLLCLNWVPLKDISLDYHYFVHIFENDELISQVDGQPRHGAYPTSAWLPGEVIKDCLQIDLGMTSDTGTDRRINIGLYDLQTLHRLPVTDNPTGTDLGDSISLDFTQEN